SDHSQGFLFYCGIHFLAAPFLESLGIQADRAMMAAETNPRRTKMPPVASKSHPAHRNGAHASESIINPPATREPPPIFVTSRSAATLLKRARLHVPSPHRMTTIDNAIQPGRRGLNRYRPVSANKTSNPPTSMNTNSFMTRKRLPGLAIGVQTRSMRT